MQCKLNAFVVPFPVLSSFCSRMGPWEAADLVLHLKVVLLFVLFNIQTNAWLKPSQRDFFRRYSVSSAQPSAPGPLLKAAFIFVWTIASISLGFYELIVLFCIFQTQLIVQVLYGYTKSLLPAFSFRRKQQEVYGCS